MKYSVVQLDIFDKLKEINRSRLERRRARKIGIITEKNSKARRKRTPYRPRKAPHPNNVTLPLVSVIVVGRNSARHLPELIDSVKAQTYQNLEFIFIDNDSSDSSTQLVHERLPQAVIVRSDSNIGLAEGSNVGMEHAKGDLILLLKNDARMEPLVVEKMVQAMMADRDLGAIAPKIRFWEPFAELQIKAKVPAGHQLRIEVTDSTTGYTKVIDQPSRSNSSHKFLVPQTARRIKAFVQRTGLPLKQPVPIADWIGRIAGKLIRPGEQLPAMEDAKWVINNAGTWINPIGEVGDWGYCEPDAGQLDKPCLVDGFCSCCALIRRESLGLGPLFPSAFFAYFEDADASERIKSNGFKIAYLPDAVAYHKHTESAAEHELFYHYVTRRNRVIFQAAHFTNTFNKTKDARLKSWEQEGLLKLRTSEILGANNRVATDRTLLEDTLALSAQAINGAIHHRQHGRKRIGIYNEFWASRGGAELRALHLAQEMKRYGEVIIISRRPIDLKAICDHFGVSDAGLRLAIVPDFADRHTAALDVFINSAFCSKIYSQAKKSAFLVSFPHMGGKACEMSSYQVLIANSLFTQRWCQNYWPTGNTELLYPAVHVDEHLLVQQKKEQIIVSLGRFFLSGHNKKQVEMVSAFRQLIEKNALSGWRLVLIGGCNTGNPGDKGYLEQVRQLAKDLPVEILVNASADQVKHYLGKAAIYWHATGVGLTDFAPGQFEHFGMAIVEAMSHCAIPVIHDRGGATEIIQQGVNGYCFDSINALVDQSSTLIDMYKDQPLKFEQIAMAARKRSLDFSIQKHNARLARLVQQYLC